MTEQEIQVKASVWRLVNQLGFPEALKRLEGVEGPVQGLVAPTAEQAERQGAAEERSRGRGRVAPVEAQTAALGWVLDYVRRAESRADELTHLCRKADDYREAAYYDGSLEAYRDVIYYLKLLRAEPESGADAKASSPSLETPTGANP